MKDGCVLEYEKKIILLFFGFSTKKDEKEKRMGKGYRVEISLRGTVKHTSLARDEKEAEYWKNYFEIAFIGDESLYTEPIMSYPSGEYSYIPKPEIKVVDIDYEHYLMEQAQSTKELEIVNASKKKKKPKKKTGGGGGTKKTPETDLEWPEEEVLQENPVVDPLLANRLVFGEGAGEEVFQALDFAFQACTDAYVSVCKYTHCNHVLAIIRNEQLDTWENLTCNKEIAKNIACSNNKCRRGGLFCSEHLQYDPFIIDLEHNKRKHFWCFHCLHMNAVAAEAITVSGDGPHKSRFKWLMAMKPFVERRGGNIPLVNLPSMIRDFRFRSIPFNKLHYPLRLSPRSQILDEEYYVVQGRDYAEPDELEYILIKSKQTPEPTKEEMNIP